MIVRVFKGRGVFWGLVFRSRFFYDVGVRE